MTEATKFVSWQKAGDPGPPHDGPSPNLQALAKYLHDRWNVKSLGIYNRRPIRGGTSWSSHAFGAALDAGFTNRTVVDTEILPFLIGYSEELGIQRIHDYQNKRYWQAGRGWVKRSPGDGGAWLHIETVPSGKWFDNSPIADRLTEAPQRPSEPPSAPPVPKYPGKALRVGSRGPDVVSVQKALKITADGIFGRVTDQHVRQFQKAHRLIVDGVVGPVTWKALHP